jgi:hypothetical protein
MQAHGQGTVAAVQNNVARGTVAQAGLPRGIKRNAHGLLVDEADRHVCNECYNYKENKTPNCSNIRFHKRQRFDNHAWDYNQPVFTVGRGGYNGYNRRGGLGTSMVVLVAGLVVEAMLCMHRMVVVVVAAMHM